MECPQHVLDWKRINEAFKDRCSPRPDGQVMDGPPPTSL